MRAVLDPNVIISALLSRDGTPAGVLRAWLIGGFELIASPSLLEELARALAYPKLRDRIEPTDADAVLDVLKTGATTATDPDGPRPVRSPDPGDDYVIVLAQATRAVLVSGDRHLLLLSEELPVYSPANFLTLLADDAERA